MSDDDNFLYLQEANLVKPLSRKGVRQQSQKYCLHKTGILNIEDCQKKQLKLSK